jgi:hypothetical protein
MGVCLMPGDHRPTPAYVCAELGPLISSPRNDPSDCEPAVLKISDLICYHI